MVDTPVYNSELVCHVISMQYNYLDKELLLYFPELECCDMAGAVKFAKRIDEHVRQIQTFAGEAQGVCYVLINGNWEAQQFLKKK